jgi:hypothetical protein
MILFSEVDRQPASDLKKNSKAANPVSRKEKDVESD